MVEGLETIGVTYRYPKSENPVLQDVSLSFPQGTFTVIMGETGAGKSTLLMTLNGVVPDLKEGTLTGEVRLDGQDLSQFRVQTVTEYVGLVLQDPESQILSRYVKEDVAFGPRNYLVPRAEIKKRVAQALAQVQLESFENRETSQLSGGQKQRLAIAGILALQPKILCLDEPTSELDPVGREEIYLTIDSLRKSSDATIIAVEHSSADVVDRADRIVVMANGVVSWEGSPRDFFTDMELVGRSKVKQLPIATVGNELVKAGLIRPKDIPLSVEEAVSTVARLSAGSALAPPLPAQSDEDAAEQNDVAVQINDLHFRYPGGQRGLQGVDLTIKSGEYVALVGRNGAGKTTLAKQLNGIFLPTKGNVLVGGEDTRGVPSWELAQKVGYVFQNPDHQIFSTTVEEEIRFGLKQTRLDQKEIDKRVQEVLEFTGLESVRDEHPYSLGKGERQRLAVASILALRPGVLVVDEPTTGQDWAGVQTMMGLIDELNAAGTTIVMVTHDMDIVARHAKRMIVMDDGRVTADGPPAAVLADSEVLQQAAVNTTQPAELCRTLWPGSPVILDPVALGEHLASQLEVAKNDA